MDEEIIIRDAEEREICWVNAKYDEIGFKHADYSEGIILIAEIDGKKAGLGRLLRVDSNSFELGGMYVFPSYRKAGIARVMVETLLDRAKRSPRIFCLPFAHLAQFYRGFGFYPAPNDVQVPEAVASKLNWCNNTYPDMTLVLFRKGADFYSEAPD